MTFNIKEHLINIKGKDYLPVSARLVWFREDHPDWSIETKIKDYREEKAALAKAHIKDETGRIIATGHKTGKPRGIISDYVELAETGAIGRALAYCGYGTQFSSEIMDEENRVIVDSPLERKETVETPLDPNKGIKPYMKTLSGMTKSKQYFATAKEAGVEAMKAKDIVKKQFNLESYNDVEEKQLKAMINAMKKKVDSKPKEELTLTDEEIDIVFDGEVA